MKVILTIETDEPFSSFKHVCDLVDMAMEEHADNLTWARPFSKVNITSIAEGYSFGNDLTGGSRKAVCHSDLMVKK